MMSKKGLSERQIRELELLMMMTNEYERFLIVCENGGDWTLYSFMKSLNSKAKKVLELDNENL